MIHTGGSDTVSYSFVLFFLDCMLNRIPKTASTVQAFFLAMALHPEAQKKAHAELDAVLGGKRLPDFDDRASLPYINAMAKESMRWSQVAPLGMICDWYAVRFT